MVINRHLCLVLAVAVPLTVKAQPRGVAPATAYSDTVRTLIVFVQFRDDNSVGDPKVHFRDWPVGLAEEGEIPGFGKTLLAEDDDGPFPDSTLSGYFYDQSQGRFVIYGDVHPEIIVTDGQNSRYHVPNGGYADLTREVVGKLDASGVDFRRFDHNGDGILDNLLIVLRTDIAKQQRKITYTGISCLHARCGGGIAAGPEGEQIEVDGIKIDWDRSGSFIFNRSAGNIDPQTWIVRMIAHELGHDIWRRHFNHIPPFSDNDVPGSSNRGPGTRSIGYVLMAGAGGGADNHGDHTVSAFERLLLGWIDCPLLEAEQKDVRLADLYTGDGCYQVETSSPSRSARYLILSNRQRVGFWDRVRKGGLFADGTGPRWELGLLRTTGLLVMLTDGRRVDVLPADNTLDNRLENAAYDGDLWRPGDAQISPWTRPNVSGFAVHPPRRPVAWFAIDRIRYADDGVTIVFDFLPDFRQSPIIRRDSWITDASAGTSINGGLALAPGVDLHVETNVSVSGHLRLHPRARLSVSAGDTLRVDGSILLAHDSVLDIAGDLIVSGFVVPTAGSSIRTPGTGRIRWGQSTLWR